MKRVFYLYRVSTAQQGDVVKDDILTSQFIRRTVSAP